MTDHEHSELLFLANDAVENIARIKAASWRVLVTAAVITAFFTTSDFLKTNPYAYIGYAPALLFLAVIVCFVYPQKLHKYRSRLKNVLGLFSQQARDVHGGFKKLDQNDAGDLTYQIASLIYFIVLYGIILADRFAITK